MTSIRSTTDIRRADVADAAALAALGAATFTEAFGRFYPAEDLEAFLESTHAPDTWRRTLADPKRAVWIVEAADRKPIGYICVGPCKLPIEPREPTAGEVHQLYVLAEFHGRKLGTRLMDAGLDWLNASGQTPIYVGVYSQNHGAQRLYARYGFEKVGEYGFRVGETVDREFIMRRPDAASR